MNLVERFRTPEEAMSGVKDMLARKEKIMGFGHAVYKESDPRSAVVKTHAATLVHSTEQRRLFSIFEAIEQVMWAEKRLFPNLDFYGAALYHFLGIQTLLFTPIFAVARTAGWCAHVLEQRSDNRLIRPSADYVGPSPRPVPTIAERAV